MKLKFLGFALLAVCVCAVCCMCGSDSKTPDYEFPDGPDPDPDPQPGDYPAGLTVTEFTDDLGGGKQCLGFVAVADLKANPKLRFNAVHLPQQKTPSRIHAEFASANRGTACVTINAGYWWAGNSLSLLVTGGAVKSIENQTVTRNNQTVYPVRSSFGQMASGGFETHWIYCVLDDGNKPYAFPSSLDNDERTNTYMSAPPTSKTPGAVLWTPQEAVGGGPMLVKEGKNVAVENYWKEVFDGGGITPDVEMTPEYVSRFALVVYGKGYIDEFGDAYALATKEREIPLEGYELPDSVYAAFVEFMADKDVEFESNTKRAVQRLREAAESELYLEGIEEQIAAIEENLKDDKQSNLEIHRKELGELIEDDILLRRYYLEGVTSHAVARSAEVLEAIELLGDRARYDSILGRKADVRAEKDNQR